MSDSISFINSLIRNVPDFPKPGIMFKDITPLLGDPAGLKAALDLLVAPFKGKGITKVAGIESRGFIFGVPLADRLGVGFVPIRKPGKLPAATVKASYALEYGTDTIEMHKDAMGSGDTVLLVDDLLATGGTASAAVQLIQSTGAAVTALAFVIELDFLQGRSKLSGHTIHSLLHY